MDTDITNVIDWDEAMEQCGGDEEFLLELLGDMKEELNTQIRKIEIAIVSTYPLQTVFSFFPLC